MKDSEEDNTYNEEPVMYCRNCLSLKIRTVAGMEDADYCDECGSTEISETTIQEWQELYKDKYGHYYLNNKY